VMLCSIINVAHNFLPGGVQTLAPVLTSQSSAGLGPTMRSRRWLSNPIGTLLRDTAPEKPRACRLTSDIGRVARASRQKRSDRPVHGRSDLLHPRSIGLIAALSRSPSASTRAGSRPTLPPDFRSLARDSYLPSLQQRMPLFQCFHSRLAGAHRCTVAMNLNRRLVVWPILAELE
jgi:hypothetical protein